MSRNSKGPRFERETCRALSRWVSGGRRLDCFWRSAMSGGRATTLAKRGECLDAHAGDIAAQTPEGYAFTRLFVAECKFYKDLKLPCLFTGDRHPKGGAYLHDWWAKLLGECKGRRLPLLIVKQNITPAFVVTSQQGVLKLRRGGRLKVYAIIPTDKATMYWCHLDEMLRLKFRAIAASTL